EEIQTLFSKDDPTSEKISIPVAFFSKEDKVPKQELADKLAAEIRKEERIPKGNYTVTLYKNFIVNRVGLPDGKNVDVEDIIK
ncbi:hypothetical protein HB827_14290, partial [Listeria innocua]|nr:hypothetical protein [Listeria innocua]